MKQVQKSLTLQLPEEDWVALECEAKIVNLLLEQSVRVKFRQRLRGWPT